MLTSAELVPITVTLMPTAPIQMELSLVPANQVFKGLERRVLVSKDTAKFF